MTSNASIVFWGDSPLIITSAHSVYEWYNKCFSESICFFDCLGNEIKIDYIILSRKWIDQGILDFDTAILIPKKINEDRYDKIHPKFCISRIGKVLVTYQKKILFINKIVSYNRNVFNDDLYNSSMIGVKIKTKKGLSGSPWYYVGKDKLYQVSNTSLSFKKKKRLTFAPYWGHYIQEMFKYTEDLTQKNKEFMCYSLF
ncbi:hypothetical protein N9R04_10500 [Staphylococcus sp. SQ8-PEA]|uniref:Uncharacterized protein n=1 Tax=Staphylococcus marylandisciuri TaxID=2981529 RepID=A0ABT2QT13_9STAP|nr:hypothetical protein [Staphylococcus marylandisciuri]MCU5747092.1 hypothetical protein [Staphylococcus marylandisciuri]